jgi:hypothetical protein
VAAGVHGDGQQGLKRRGREPGERELIRTPGKLGEIAIRMELAREVLEKRGRGDVPPAEHEEADHTRREARGEPPGLNSTSLP